MLEAIVFDGKRRLGRMDAPTREGRGGRKRAIKVTLRQLAVFEQLRDAEASPRLPTKSPQSVRSEHGAA